MKKRTRQLQDAEQIALPSVGPDVFVERGNYELSEAEKEEVANNLKIEGPFRRKVDEYAAKILAMQAAFIEGFFVKLPKDKLPGLNFVFDGPKVAAKHKETTLAVYNPKIPRDYEKAVGFVLQSIRNAANGAPPNS